ncbi:MAG: flippase-like domain-containing protein, partial [Crenarchaeota archaeon]|nr:flippase-like domain-containing protein [Thermoproteota archaeon]
MYCIKDYISMNISKPSAKLTRKTILLPVIGIVAFFLYILLFNVDLIMVIETAKTANPIIYSAAILMGFAEIFFFAISWRSLLSSLKVKISVMRSFLYTWYGIFLDIVIPAESITGELCRIYLVNREQPGTSGKTTASLVTQRLISMAINVVMLVVGIIFIANTMNLRPDIFWITLLFTVGITAIIIVVMLISWKENWSKKMIDGVIRLCNWITRKKWEQKLESVKEQVISAAKTFHDSMKEMGRNPKKLVLPTFYLALNWITSIAVPYLVFLSLGYDVPWTIILVTTSIVIAVKSIPLGIPFEVGLPEITMTTIYTGLLDGIIGPQAAIVSATATILIRLITLW